MRSIIKSEEDYYSYVSLMSEFGDMSSFSYKDYCDFFDFNNTASKIVLFLEQDKKVVGTLSILFDYKPFHKAFAVHIEDVVVSKELRGKGIGKTMILSTLQHINKFLSNNPSLAGVYKYVLSCNKDNIKFYESCGFRQNETEMRLDV